MRILKIPPEYNKQSLKTLTMIVILFMLQIKLHINIKNITEYIHLI